MCSSDLTQIPLEGVGPSRMKSMYQPGGAIAELGGAVRRQAKPVQVNWRNNVRAPIVLPCVLEEPKQTLRVRDGPIVNYRRWIVPAIKEKRKLAIEGDFALIAYWPP